MAERTNIEWCDASLNLWWGCTKVSQGCKHCYAEHLSDQRYGRGCWGPTGTRQEVKSWRSTLNKISRRAKAEGRRLKVFCSSMCDVFEGPDTMGGDWVGGAGSPFINPNYEVTRRLRAELLALVPEHPELDFLLLTKRPENILKMVPDKWLRAWPINAWIGTSVEDQATADERIPHLLNIPARVRFLSCEPLVGAVEFYEEGHCCKKCGRLLTYGTEEDASYEVPCVNCGCTRWVWDLPSNKASFGDGDLALDWVICGGEAGANARPMDPNWARSLRDQCRDAGVPFFFKQWGEWLPADHFQRDPEYVRWSNEEGLGMCITEAPGFTHVRDGMFRVGKKRAGSLLDGEEWKQFPEGWKP